jgi:predicted dehydrogenase
MVRIGIAGMGFMGVTHFRAIEKIRGAQVVAICTRDPRKLRGDWRKVQGNFGGSGGVQDVSKLGRYAELNALLADPKVDLVDLCLPTSMHVEWSVKALEAGKHLLLEKPIALDLRGADRILAAARAHKRLFMVAHVLRYFPEFRLVKELMEQGDHGPVLAAHFKRIIARPAWWDPKDLYRTGGPAIDLHIHDADFVQYLFGMPEAVTSSGYVGKGGAVEHLHTHYHFPGKAVTAEGGWLSQQGCPFEHGYDVYFEKATLKYNSSWGQPPLLLTIEGRKKHPALPGKDGFVGEIGEAVKAVREGAESAVLGGRSARDSLLLCLREVQSIRSGRRVKI